MNQTTPAENEYGILRWSAMTHPGKIRKKNEDRFLGIAFDGHMVQILGKHGEWNLAQGDVVFAVSDGMGGAKAGEFASRVVLDQLMRWLPKGFRVGVIGMSDGFVDLLTEMFSEVHRNLEFQALCYEECRGMGATLSLAWFSPGWMRFAHIGDSRIYFLPAAEGMKQLTQDDSHVGWLEKKGKLTEYEARYHPARHAINKVLGGGHQFVDPQVGAVGYEARDRFVLCSDGVIDGLWNRQLQRLIREPEGAEIEQDPAARVVTAALENSGRDNITAVVVEAL